MADFIDAKHLKGARQTMMTCTYCGFCKSVCPVYEGIGWDSSVARGRIILAYGLLKKDIPADESVVENLYQCTTCKDCERRCPSGIEVVDVVERARRDLVANDIMLPQHRKLLESILGNGNPYGERNGVAATLGLKKRSASLGYFVGCTSAYRNRNIADATLSILNKLDEDFTVVDEVCCGSVLQRIGANEAVVEEIVERNVRSAADLGVDEVIFSCAGCYRMFKEEYPKFVDVPFKVRHISEFLAERDLKLKPLDKKLTYHDPCHLGRHSGVYDAPRDLLSKIPKAEFKEMTHHRETALCCGGGGGVRSAYPDLSEKVAARRVDEAAFADILVTTCPFCVSNLRVGKEKASSPVEIKDLVELIEPLVEVE
jgi:Fe-S oxidoreductase